MARYTGVATEITFQHAVVLSPASVAANTTAEQTFAVPGLTLGGVAFVNKPTAQAGLGIVGVRISANNQIAITFSNNTASPIVPTASETYQIGVIRIIGN
jgi:hypothetical protein